MYSKCNLTHFDMIRKEGEIRRRIAEIDDDNSDPLSSSSSSAMAESIGFVQPGIRIISSTSDAEIVSRTIKVQRRKSRAESSACWILVEDFEVGVSAE